MPRATAPFSAEAEIAAYKIARSEQAASGILSSEIAQFVQSGVAVIFGAHDPQDGPLSGIGLAARVLPSGRVRLLLRRGGHDRLLLALMRDCRIAATFSRPVTHRSVQLKGTDAVISAVTPEDLRAAASQTQAFMEDLIESGYPPGISAAYNAFDTSDVVAVEFTPSAVFAQTPGPGAGSEVTA